MRSYEVVLFQPYLRQFVLNFGKYLRHGAFRLISNAPKQTGYASLPNFEREIHRTKLTWQNRLRRLIGIPNIRPWFRSEGDILFTYACLVITLKPYCTYLETGLALYNYDVGIASHPFARLLVTLLATRSNCKQLIFLSEASKESFYSSVSYPAWAKRILEAKSSVIYPVPTTKQLVEPKRFSGELKLLFPGTFYIKGGMEVVQAYERLRRQYGNVSLTIVTALHMMKQADRNFTASLPGLTLLDAKLSADQMTELYRTHDLFLLPTYRDGFGLVVIEALANGLPTITTDQYAIAELVSDGETGFVVENPLKDYHPTTFELYGKFYNPRDFYQALFSLQRTGRLRPVADFIVRSVERFLEEPALLERFSRQSLARYDRLFDADKLGAKLEAVFESSLSER